MSVLCSSSVSAGLLEAELTRLVSGIGRAVAILYAREGCGSTIVYLPEEQDDAEECKRLVEAEGQKCLLVPYDLRDFRGTKTIVDQHVKAFGGLNILVNNA